MKFNKRPLICALGFASSTSVFAVTNDIEVDLGASTRLTDNAMRQYENGYEERQNQYGIGLVANYSNEWTQLNSKYVANKFTFDKGSQLDRSILEGETEINFGNVYQPLSLLLSHSRRSLLNQPDAIDLVSNRDERDIIAAKPLLKWKLSPSDFLAVGATYSQISYRVADAKDSAIKGLILSWQLGLSKTDNVEFSFEENKIDFEEASLANYQYQSLNAKYSSKLRNLEYSLSAGANRASEGAGDSFTRPSFDVSIAYFNGPNTFRFLANRRLTDTSTGNGNNIGLGGSQSEPVGAIVSIVDLSNAELSWTSDALCERCQTNVNAFGGKQDYQDKSKNYSELGAGVGFKYKLTRAADLSFNTFKSKKLFEPDSDNHDYTMVRVNVGLSYKFQNDLQAKVYKQLEKRDTSVLANTYDEHSVGFSLSYSF